MLSFYKLLPTPEPSLWTDKKETGMNTTETPLWPLQSRWQQKQQRNCGSGVDSLELYQPAPLNPHNGPAGWESLSRSLQGG